MYMREGAGRSPAPELRRALVLALCCELFSSSEADLLLKRQ